MFVPSPSSHSALYAPALPAPPGMWLRRKPTVPRRKAAEVLVMRLSTCGFSPPPGSRYAIFVAGRPLAVLEAVTISVIRAARSASLGPMHEEPEFKFLQLNVLLYTGQGREAGVRCGWRVGRFQAACAVRAQTLQVRMCIFTMCAHTFEQTAVQASDPLSMR